MNVDRWVSQFSVHFIKTHPIERSQLVSRNVLFGSFLHHGQQESIDQWEIIDTIGDGSCLIHSFLLLLSDSYRALQTNDKKTVARAFRMMIEPLIPFDDNRYYGQPSERDIMRNVGQGNQSDGWLNDIIADKIAAFLGYGLIMLRFMETPNGVPAPQLTSTDNHGLPYLIIANKGGIVGANDSGNHFEAIKRNRLRISPPQIGDDIEPKKNELFIATMNLMNVKPRCDSPRQRRSELHSISAQEAKRLAKLFDLYKKGDTKAVLCEKLQEINQVDWYDKGKPKRSSRKAVRKGKFNSRKR